MKPEIVILYNHNGPVRVDSFNVEARLRAGWTREPVKAQEPEPAPAPPVADQPIRARKRKGAA